MQVQTRFRSWAPNVFDFETLCIALPDGCLTGRQNQTPSRCTFANTAPTEGFPTSVSRGSIDLGIDTILVTRHLGRRSQLPSEHTNSQVFIRLASDVTTGARYQGNRAELKGSRDRQSVLALPFPDPAKIAHAAAADRACVWVHGLSCPDIILAPACSHW